MLLRSALRRTGPTFACVRCAQRRSYAATTSGPLNFEASEVSGLKIASKSVPGPISSLAVVSRAGSRYEWVPGLSEGLEKFAFRNTYRRFAVRIVREAEILGSELFTNRTREAVVFGAKFMQEDLPYFVELCAEITKETRYVQYMLDEVIDPIISEAHHKFLRSTSAIALNAAHGVAFHRGLGNALYPSAYVPAAHRVVAAEINAYANVAYLKPNFALVGSGIEHAELSKWAGEFFKDAPTSAPEGLPALQHSPTKYYGGEERISHNKGNTLIIAFHGSGFAGGSSYKPEIDVLATLLGGQTRVKWATGHSLLGKVANSHPGVSITTETSKYSDGGLLQVVINGPAKLISAAAKGAVTAIKSVSSGQISKEDVKRAIAQAKFKAYDLETATPPALDVIGLSAIANGKVQTTEELLKGPSSVSESAVNQAAKKLLEGKASVAAVGDLSQLPFAEELGLNV